jgi:alpha-galactosidase
MSREVITRSNTMAMLVVAAICAPITTVTDAQPADTVHDDGSFTLAGLEVALQGDTQLFDLSVRVRKLAPGVEVATIRLQSATRQPPPRLKLSWSIPAQDVHGQWNSGARFRKTLGPDWGPSGVSSKLSRNAPVISLFGADDGNRLTFAVSDALNTVELTAGLREEDASVYAGVELFTEAHRSLSEFEIDLRIDRRDVPFHQALGDVSEWWTSFENMVPAPVPDTARQPMYSTWYSYHQNVDAAALLREVKAGKDLGLGAIIVDDGWQTLDSNRGYAFTGDWQPERVPEMKEFVDAVHAQDVQVLLWYSLPLVGERSAIYAKFEGKYLRYWDGQGAYVLDPRYPEVREHIIDTYRRAMADWGIDGFKLDFLGFLAARDDTELTLANGRDYASVNEATDRLMTDIMLQLRRVQSDIMIEFRQPYIGPLMRKYGNMFRAGDAPDATVDNRIRIIDLRLLSGDTAVHSDMLMWHRDETREAAALQILNVLFSVPQISVRLHDIPADHQDMLEFWMDYWLRNREILLDGKFEPHQPLGNYPQVTASNSDKRIVALYQNTIVNLDAESAVASIDIVNAKSSGDAVVVTEDDLGNYRASIFDVSGNETSSELVSLDTGAHRFTVPPSGLLTLQRQ